MTAAAQLSLFYDLDTWEERYQYLMDMGADLPSQPDSFKIPERRVHGCQSRVWMQIDFVEGRCQLTVESDALLVRGLLAVIHALVADKTATEIITSDLDIPQIIGLQDKLSITRLHGINAVITAITTAAQAELHS